MLELQGVLEETSFDPEKNPFVRVVEDIVEQLTTDNSWEIHLQFVDAALLTKATSRTVVGLLFEHVIRRHDLAESAANLCESLSVWSCTTAGLNFERHIVGICQVYFERLMLVVRQPEDLQAFTPEEVTGLKLCAEGSVKFIGHLVALEIISIKVCASICQEFFSAQTPLAQDMFRVLLAAVGAGDVAVLNEVRSTIHEIADAWLYPSGCALSLPVTSYSL